jgi:hypothetical protein
MSRVTVLITVLVLGTSATAAMASPGPSYDRRGVIERGHIERGHIERSRIERSRIERAPIRIEQAPIRIEPAPDRFGRHDHLDRGWRGVARDDFGPRRYRPTWTALAAPLALQRGGQGCIELADPGTFTQLRLQTDGGIARIERVVVEFADGSDQVVYPARVLDDRGDLLEIPLDGNNRRIERILVTGDTRAGGAVEVFAI